MAQRRLGLIVLAMLAALADLSASSARAGPELVVGPARQGETTAYRITVDGDGADAEDRTPHSALVTITWKSRTRYLARVGDDPTSVVLAHDTGGALTLENVNARDAGMAQLSTYLVYFARAAELAAAAARGDRTETTLHVEPARPRDISSRLTIERESGTDQQAADVPVIVTCTRRDGMTVIEALGSVKMEGRPQAVRGRPRPVAMTTRVAASAEFDAAGVLTHETWQESTDIPEQDGTRTLARTVTIEIAR